MSEEQKVINDYVAWALQWVHTSDWLIDPERALAKVAERTGLPLEELKGAFASSIQDDQEKER